MDLLFVATVGKWGHATHHVNSTHWMRAHCGAIRTSTEWELSSWPVLMCTLQSWAVLSTVLLAQFMRWAEITIFWNIFKLFGFSMEIP